MMKIYAKSNIISCLGSFRLGIIQAEVICKESSKFLQEFMSELVSELETKYTIDSIRVDNIIAATREAYKKTEKQFLFFRSGIKRQHDSDCES